MEAVIIEDLVDYGFEQGLEQGLERGREQGLVRGLAQGEVNGARQSLLDLLDARGLKPNVEQCDRIANEMVLANVRAWFRRALTASSMDEVID